MPGTLRFRYFGAVACFALILLGCATTRMPEPAAFQAVERAIAEARAAGAEAQAPMELRIAEERLNAARRAQAERAARSSEQALAEALVAAELAQAKSRVATARAAVQARRQENALLRRELLGAGEAP